MSGEATVGQEVPPRRKRAWPRLLLPLIAASLVAAAALAALVTISITWTNETAELSDSLEREQSRAESLNGQLTSYKEREQELVDREVAVEAREVDADDREVELERREAAVSKVEQQVAATTLKDGHVYTVGSTMEAGTYQANATGGSCYWAIYTSGTNYSDIVENDYGSMGSITVTVSAGQDFRSSKCGDWTKVG